MAGQVKALARVGVTACCVSQVVSGAPESEPGLAMRRYQDHLSYSRYYDSTIWNVEAIARAAAEAAADFEDASDEGDDADDEPPPPPVPSPRCGAQSPRGNTCALPTGALSRYHCPDFLSPAEAARLVYRPQQDHPVGPGGLVVLGGGGGSRTLLGAAARARRFNVAARRRSGSAGSSASRQRLEGVPEEASGTSEDCDVHMSLHAAAGGQEVSSSSSSDGNALSARDAPREPFLVVMGGPVVEASDPVGADVPWAPCSSPQAEGRNQTQHNEATGGKVPVHYVLDQPRNAWTASGKLGEPGLIAGDEHPCCSYKNGGGIIVYSAAHDDPPVLVAAAKDHESSASLPGSGAPGGDSASCVAVGPVYDDICAVLPADPLQARPSPFQRRQVVSALDLSRASRDAAQEQACAGRRCFQRAASDEMAEESDQRCRKPNAAADDVSAVLAANARDEPGCAPRDRSNDAARDQPPGGDIVPEGPTETGGALTQQRGRSASPTPGIREEDSSSALGLLSGWYSPSRRGRLAAKAAAQAAAQAQKVLGVARCEAIGNFLERSGVRSLVLGGGGSAASSSTTPNSSCATEQGAEPGAAVALEDGQREFGIVPPRQSLDAPATSDAAVRQEAEQQQGIAQTVEQQNSGEEHAGASRIALPTAQESSEPPPVESSGASRRAESPSASWFQRAYVGVGDAGQEAVGAEQHRLAAEADEEAPFFLPTRRGRFALLQKQRAAQEMAARDRGATSPPPLFLTATAPAQAGHLHQEVSALHHSLVTQQASGPRGREVLRGGPPDGERAGPAHAQHCVLTTSGASSERCPGARNRSSSSQRRSGRAGDAGARESPARSRSGSRRSRSCTPVRGRRLGILPFKQVRFSTDVKMVTFEPFPCPS